MVRTIQQTVSLLPEDHPDYDNFLVYLEWRGGEAWAVTHLGRCLGRDGEWDHEPSYSGRTDTWLAAHRFDHDEALGRACEAAPLVTVNGRTVENALKRGQR